MCLSTEQEAHTAAQRQKHNAALSHALSNRETGKNGQQEETGTYRPLVT